MITVNNYVTDVKRYGVTIPEGFKASHEMMIEYHHELEVNGDSDAIKETAETANKYVKMLNMYLVKHGFVFKDKSPRMDSKTTPKDKKEVAKKSKTAKVAESKKTVEKHEPTKSVEKIPEEVAIFSQYLKFHNKSIDIDKVEAIIRRIKKAVTENVIKSTSPYKKEFNDMAKDLVDTYNSTPANKQSILFEIPEELRNELTHICEDIGLKSSVVLIKKFLTEYGRENKQKIEKLLLLTAKKMASGEVPKNDSHIKELKELKKYSEDYLASGHWRISQEQLNGLGSIAGISEKQLPTEKSAVVPPNKVMNTKEFVKLHFSELVLTGKWKTFIGKPSPKFRMMIFGKPGCGKSTLGLLFGHYLASDLNKKCLYVANEEALRKTLQDKIIDLKLEHENFDVVEDIPINVGDWDYVFFDSADDLKIEPSEMKELDKKHIKTTFTTIHKVTKDGIFKGSNDWEHDCDISINVAEGIAKIVKNRCGGTGTLKVY